MEILEILEENLKCGICKDILYHPVTLLCQHTFCNYCLSCCNDNHCPICRKIFIMPKGYNKELNHVIKSLYRDKYKEKSKDISREIDESRRKNEIFEEIYEEIISNIPNIQTRESTHEIPDDIHRINDYVRISSSHESDNLKLLMITAKYYWWFPIIFVINSLSFYLIPNISIIDYGLLTVPMSYVNIFLAFVMSIVLMAKRIYCDRNINLIAYSIIDNNHPHSD